MGSLRYKPILMGQNPGPGCDPSYPLYPYPREKSGGRLCQLMGLTTSKYISTFQRTNLVNDFRYDADRARETANIFKKDIEKLKSGEVFLIGKLVCEAFGMRDLNFFEFTEVGRSKFYAIPHPSGSNRWYNNSDNVERAKRFWRGYLKHIGAID